MQTVGMLGVAPGLSHAAEQPSPPRIISREEAKAQRLHRFFTGKPCSRGHLAERSVATWGCCACAEAYRAEASRQELERQEAARIRELERKREEHLRELERLERELQARERRAAAGGWSLARSRGAALPADYATVADLIVATLPFYSEARRLSRETGEPHQVDHVMPLALGGEHRPENLMVVSRAFNAAKRARENEEMVERFLSGTFTPPSPAAEREIVGLLYDRLEGLAGDAETLNPAHPALSTTWALLRVILASDNRLCFSVEKVRSLIAELETATAGPLN
jgi:hypothetical protein